MAYREGQSMSEDPRMPDNATLLEVRNLKVHFPIEKGILLRRRVGWLKAVDDVTRVGLTVKDSPDSVLIWTSFLRSGAPFGRVPVEIRDDETKIITTEDPVEYQLKGVNQIPVKPKIGLTFATGLRHIVRQDPDVILVGEMRDLETIELALTAAETGHLVFGTLHTNSAPKTIERIINVFPHGQQEQIRMLLSEGLKGVIAQNLLRHDSFEIGRAHV